LLENEGELLGYLNMCKCEIQKKNKKLWWMHLYIWPVAQLLLNHTYVIQNGILEPLAPKYEVLWEKLSIVSLEISLWVHLKPIFLVFNVLVICVHVREKKSTALQSWDLRGHQNPAASVPPCDLQETLD